MDNCPCRRLERCPLLLPVEVPQGLEPSKKPTRVATSYYRELECKQTSDWGRAWSMGGTGWEGADQGCGGEVRGCGAWEGEAFLEGEAC